MEYFHLFFLALHLNFGTPPSTSFRALVSISSPRLPPFLIYGVSFTYFVLCPCTGLLSHQQNKAKTKHLNCADLWPITSFLRVWLLFSWKITLSFPVPKWWSFGIIMRWVEFLFLPVMSSVMWSSHVMPLSFLICKVILIAGFLNYFKQIIIGYV